jgi:hypothetical protein
MARREDLLRFYVVSLDRYRADGGAADDLRAFLNWVRPN